MPWMMLCGEMSGTGLVVMGAVMLAGVFGVTRMIPGGRHGRLPIWLWLLAGGGLLFMWVAAWMGIRAALC